MSDEQQLLGEPYEIIWRDRTLKLSGITEGVIAKCVAAAKLAAHNEHQENIDLLYPTSDPETQSRRQRADRDFGDSMVTGRWKWGGDLQEAWRRGPDGMRTMIAGMLEYGGNPLSFDEINQLANDEQGQVFAVIALAMWDSTNPNRPRPAALMEKLAGLLKLKTSTRTSAESSASSPGKSSG